MSHNTHAVRQVKEMVPFLIIAMRKHHNANGFAEYNRTKYVEQETLAKFHELLMEAVTSEDSE